MSKRSESRLALSRYLAEVRALPLLELAEERELLREIRAGRPGARRKLIEGNLAFVVKLATEYRSSGVPLEDLINEGNLGLIEAARRMDPSRETRFITYAIWWIRKFILRALADKARIVRIPSCQARRVREVKTTRDRLRQDLGREPSRAEISARLSLAERKVDQILGVRGKSVSLDRPVVEHQGRAPGDVLEDGGRSSEQVLLENESLAAMFEGFRELDARQKRVVVLRFGLDGAPPRSLEEVGRLFGLSRERVRQIEMKAVNRVARRVRYPRWSRESRRRPGASSRGERSVS